MVCRKEAPYALRVSAPVKRGLVHDLTVVAKIADMNMPCLKGQLKNANLAIDTATNKLMESEPRAAIVQKQKEMRDGKLANTVRSCTCASIHAARVHSAPLPHKASCSRRPT